MPQIIGNKLPTNKQMMKVLFFNTRHVNLTTKDSIALVVKEALIFWEKVNIPTQKFERYCKKLKKLYEEYRSVQKNMGVPSNIDHEKDFTAKLNLLFNVAHGDVFHNITDKQKGFLLDQMSLEPKLYIADFAYEITFDIAQGMVKFQNKLIS